MSVKRRLPELTAPEAEIQRLRGIFWEILKAAGAELPRKIPETHDPDIPEWALQAVEGLRDEMAEYAGTTGADINPDAGPDEVCTCGEVITWHRRWLHLFNPELRRYTSHNPCPATGYYDPRDRARREAAPDDLAEQIMPRLQRVAEERELRGTPTEARYDAPSWTTLTNTTTGGTGYRRYTAGGVSLADGGNIYYDEPVTGNDEEGL